VEDYTIDYNEKGTDFCIVGIQAGDYGLYILGDSFLRSFLSIYDFQSKRVGLALHKNSNGSIGPYQSPSNFGVLALMIFLAVLCLLIGLFYLFKIYKASKASRLQSVLDSFDN